MAVNLVGIGCNQYLISISTERIIVNGFELHVIFGIDQSSDFFQSSKIIQINLRGISFRIVV